jgi:hypothetical protein
MRKKIYQNILNSVNVFLFISLTIITFSFQSEAKANSPNFLSSTIRNCLSGDDCSKNPDVCKDGYVWREIDNRDRVCVSPESREQTKRDNKEAAKRKQLFSDTCKTGYVWREAFVGDKVCVTTETRSKVKYDNSQSLSRRACKDSLFTNIVKNINTDLKKVIASKSSDKSENNTEPNETKANLEFEKTTNVNSGGKNLDKPKLLTTRFTVFNTKGNDEENFFAFMGEGEIEIIYDLKLQGRSGLVNITLLDKNGDELSREVTTSAYYNGSDRAKHTIDIGEKQLVIIKVVSVKGGFEEDRTLLKIALKKGIAR